MDVSIIIVNYNTRDLLVDCINSIKEMVLGVSYEIIIVDNNSNDSSQEVIEKSFPDVVFIEAGTNLGFGKANNLGAAKARGEYLFFLNSDTLLINDAVTLFLQFSRTNASIGALGTILENKNGDTVHSYGEFTSLKNEFKDCVSKYLRFFRNKELIQPGKITKPLFVDYITGADLFMPSHVFKELGGFDPDYFMYSEECDLQYRMSLKTIPRFIIPGPRIIHLEGGSDTSKTKKWSYNRYYNMTTAKMLYIQKHLSKTSEFFFRVIDIVFLTPIIIVSKYTINQKLMLIKTFFISKKQ